MRNHHQIAVEAYLKNHFSTKPWEFTYPEGHGNETYFAQSGNEVYFVKLGSQIARYQAMASIGLTPPVLSFGFLEDGTSIIVQPYINGRTPTRRDFRTHIDDFAFAIKKAHQCEPIKVTLSVVFTDQYSLIGLQALDEIQTRWRKYRPLLPTSADYIDKSLIMLREKVSRFTGTGLVASHNDINNSNWIITGDGHLFLIDLDSMSHDDPALDVGAILWWYYPPEMRKEFLEIVGYAHDNEFKTRMQVRMAMHCLNIILPRENSVDHFDSDAFNENLTDFRAIMAGEENPQGYYDD